MVVHDGTVVVLMGLAQLGQHGQFVVKVRQAAVRVQRPRIQNGLGRPALLSDVHL